MLGHLISARATSGFATQYLKQVEVWDEELHLLNDFIKALISRERRSQEWVRLLEYVIPRRNKSPDVAILAEDLIFIIEFKFGTAAFEPAAKWQVEDYALDIRDFHLESQGRTIIPILVATSATMQSPLELPAIAGKITAVWPVVCLPPSHLAPWIAAAFDAAHRPEAKPIDPHTWENSAYRPTLSILDAAQELFAGHSVREIAHAYADNLSTTTSALIHAIDSAKRSKTRTICFVTGVPGAGKTLTGLNAIHSPESRAEQSRPGVFLSGNGPLVRIVREALVRNAARLRGWSKKHATREVGTFIQNVHSFIDEYTSHKPTERPFENAVVFDEAQRAWNSDQVKKKRRLERSEPAIMLEIMERCPDWCVLVALVGGGQEIHQGEAGLEEWGRALAGTAKEWHVLVSPEALHGGESLAGHRLFAGASPSNCRVTENQSLHLGVSVRSYRAQTMTQWVNLVVAGRADAAAELLAGIREFPLVLTRDLGTARHWLRARSRLEHRCGLVVSSGSVRHRAYGIEVSSAFRHGFPFEEWFLADAGDVRSSFRLEVAATEFECQGLELDWIGLCWGDDLSIESSRSAWLCRQFRGNQWQTIRSEHNRQYLFNKYRVLLTRAREGMVIWVPPGDPEDPTRDPRLLDATAAYLKTAGVPELP
jgi:Uncharacterized conserved protein (DUF2075)